LRKSIVRRGAGDIREFADSARGVLPVLREGRERRVRELEGREEGREESREEGREEGREAAPDAPI